MHFLGKRLTPHIYEGEIPRNFNLEISFRKGLLFFTRRLDKEAYATVNVLTAFQHHHYVVSWGKRLSQHP